VALNYAINPFGSLTYAWQMREMRFDSIALIRFTSTLSGALVSAVLAWKGFGPLSLALGSLTSTLTNAAMAIFFRPAHFPWLPGLREVKRVLSFGSQLTTASLLNTLTVSTPELFLGKLQGMTATGLYSRANGLVVMFSHLVINALYNVFMSWFAKQSREQENLAEPFIKATAYVSALGWSFSIFLIFLAQPLTRLLYGSQWDDSVELTRLLSSALFFGVPAALCQPAILASGQVTKALYGTALTTATTILSAAIGAFFGLIPLGLAIIVSSAINAGIWLRLVHEVINLRWQTLGLELLRSLGVAVGAAVVPVATFVVYGHPPENTLLAVVIATLGSFIGFLAAVRSLQHPLNQELKSAWLRIQTKMS
jgi:O-antigen/teichoic acid export membrane protein